MVKLEARNINYVKSIPLEIRGKVLYQFLKMGISMREIGKTIPEMAELDGWQAWAMIHFYGFDKNHKGFYQQITLKNLLKRLLDLNEQELEQFHLAEETLEDINFTYYLMQLDSDGVDLFRNIKMRMDQHQLREQLLKNYNHTCAFCKISYSKLLMTRHIKPWLESNKAERVDPTNAIILCSLHDALFANGLLSLSDQYEAIFSSDVDFTEQDICTARPFAVPPQYPPARSFLRYHREKFNLVVSQGRIF